MILDEQIHAQFDANRILSQERGEFNRNASAEVFREAARLAAANGMRLMRYTPAHYALMRMNGFLLHFHPDNQHLRRERNKPRPPMLRLKQPFTVLDVVLEVNKLEREYADAFTDKTTGDANDLPCDISGRCTMHDDEEAIHDEGSRGSCKYCEKEHVFKDGRWRTWDHDLMDGAER